MYRCSDNYLFGRTSRIKEVDPTYSIEEATESYRFHLPSGLVTTLRAALVLPPGQHEDLLLMTLLRRNVAALTDWGLVSAPGI